MAMPPVMGCYQGQNRHPLHDAVATVMVSGGGALVHQQMSGAGNRRGNRGAYQDTVTHLAGHAADCRQLLLLLLLLQYLLLPLLL
jgi:hypothetical protein